MLRINLMHDAAPEAGAVPKRATALLYLVGVLILALCACIATAGWLLLDVQTKDIRREHRELRAALSQRDSRTAPPADRAPLLDLQHANITLDAIAQQRALAPAAITFLLDTLELGDGRADNFAVHALQFDGHIVRVSGTASDATSLAPLLETLQSHRGLRDARFTALRAAEVPEPPKRRRGRATREQPVGVDFSLYAALHATPLPALD